ncbi:hypothetical protein HGO38_20900 [Rhizobium sp. CG5]|uniref:hypothetical protein n=1 Tax=Rhizobium sp. CG5 TaxID=2726076 RepID=UPI0020340856|nr:hypothetical protein [Rhizobium sp. CG5]MCM2475936.1 hypothetical protein [Rhizobium sp. CG5]
MNGILTEKMAAKVGASFKHFRQPFNRCGGKACRIAPARTKRKAFGHLAKEHVVLSL